MQLILTIVAFAIFSVGVHFQYRSIAMWQKAHTASGFLNNYTFFRQKASFFGTVSAVLMAVSAVLMAVSAVIGLVAFNV